MSANGQSFTTANDGLFRIPNLNAGTYTLTATGGGFGAVTMQAAVLSRRFDYTTAARFEWASQLGSSRAQ